MNNSEGCLVIDGQVKAVSQLALDCFLAGVPAAPDLRAGGEEVVLFGYQILSSGFLLPSELVHAYLITSSEVKLDRENQSAIWINLGLTRYLFGNAEAAREAYEKALSIASDSKIDRFVGGAEAGLGDCDLLVGRGKEAKEHYESALHLAEKSGDANIANWAHLGLGEAALAENDYSAAEWHLSKLDRIINSYQQFMRIWLGLARVRIHFEQWEEAESYLARGLSLPIRRDFAFRRQEFQKEYDRLPRRRTSL